MAYITAAYYADTYKGKPVPSADFDRLAERGSEAAAFMSPVIKLNGIADLTAAELSALMTATCVMTEFFSQVDSGAYNSERIGSYSYSGGQSMAEADKTARAQARGFLDAAGLTYCGERTRESLE